MVIKVKKNIICAESDLGVTVDGSNMGPSVIIKNLKNDDINKVIEVKKTDCIKSKDKNDLKKNLNEVNDFNSRLYNNVLNTIKDNTFPITIGGDHSIAIGSALASQKMNKNLGIIWIDAHLDYNTFETTITGNLHGLPLASLNGICTLLTNFFDGVYYNPKNTVVVGYRAMEENKDQELNNIKEMGVTVFTDNDIKECGIESIMNKAISIASDNSNGMHISYDLDVINPEYAPGVSVPEIGGINDVTAYKIADILVNNIDKIKSFDLVEFNPSFDVDDKTLNIALNILDKIIKNK